MGCGVSTADRLKSYTVEFRTGDHKGSGTNSTVYMKLFGEKNTASREISFGCFYRNDFEKGDVDEFTVKKAGMTGQVHRVEMWLGDGPFQQNWFVDTIKVRYHDQPADRGSVFPVHRWLQEGERWHLVRNDSTLPQEEKHKDQRTTEMARKKQLYQLENKFDGELCIAQVKDLPNEQQFSNKYFFDVIAKRQIILQASAFVLNLTTDKWKSFDDIMNVYNDTLPIPSGVDNWKSDEAFAAQRLTGCNPNQIKRCTAIPTNLAVTDDLLGPFLAGLTINEAIQSKRLFIVDYAILKDIPTPDDRLSCAPIALFFVDDNKTLLPVAIQLYQDPSPDNPVFVPGDPFYTWLLAKMWFNNADGAVHESVTHLGFTHLIIETIAVAAHSCMSPSHPIFKLMGPHFLYVMAINSLALVGLINPGGPIDENTNVGTVGFQELLKRTFVDWRLDVEGSLPDDLRNRGVEDPDVLPGYYYRDDAVLLYDAIRKYVKTIVDGRYMSPALLTGDSEIQQFAEKLVRPTAEGGCGIQGVAGGGKFTINDQLTSVVTSFIYLSSVGHASANFSQYDTYGFPPNSPQFIRGQPPRNKAELSESDILASLPDKKKSLEIMAFMKLLSERDTRRLGNFERIYQSDDLGKAAVARFNTDLEAIGETIRARNAGARRDQPYSALDPREIPNAISI